MNEYQVYGEVIFKEYTAFVFMGHVFRKENIFKTLVKLLESNVLNYLKRLIPIILPVLLLSKYYNSLICVK